MYAQCDIVGNEYANGNNYLLLEALIGYWKSDKAISLKEK